MLTQVILFRVCSKQCLSRTEVGDNCLFLVVLFCTSTFYPERRFPFSSHVQYVFLSDSHGLSRFNTVKYGKRSLGYFAGPHLLSNLAPVTRKTNSNGINIEYVEKRSYQSGRR